LSPYRFSLSNTNGCGQIIISFQILFYKSFKNDIKQKYSARRIEKIEYRTSKYEDWTHEKN